MPFRFNHRELSLMATRSPEEYDKEGILALREEDVKLFHKSERFIERLFRLKGNLLFYSKSKDSFSEVAGVIILDQCKLCLTSTNRKFTFAIDSNHSEDMKYELAAESKEELDAWISKIDGARYEATSQRLSSLRIDIMKMGGEDPLPDYPPIDFKKINGDESDLSSILAQSAVAPKSKFDNILPMLEICIACTDLNILQDSVKPVLTVKVLTKVSTEVSWSSYSETEPCEDTREIFFLKTFVFDPKFPTSTKLKFVLCDIRNKAKGMVTGLGQAVCCMQDIQQAQGWRLSLSLRKLESKEEIGGLVLQGWKRNPDHTITRRQSSVDFIKGHGPRDRTALTQFPRTYVGQVCEQSFHYPTSEGDDVKFQELMGESVIPFKISTQLLNLYINEEKEAVLELLKLGKLESRLDQVRNQQQNSHFDLVSQYSKSLSDISNYKERNYKRSSEKTEKELEFVTTNLHIQRMRVIEKDQEFCYDIVTFGSPAAHSMKFRPGGLKKLLESIEENTHRDSLSVSENGILMAGTKAKNVKSVLIETERAVVKLCNEIEMVDKEALKKLADTLSNKIAEILNMASSSFVQDAEKQLAASRPQWVSAESSGEGLNETSPDFVWKWNGNEFQEVPAATVSDNDDSDCGLRDELASFMSLINTLTNNSQHNFGPEDLQESSNKLCKAVKSFVKKLCVVMRFILVKKSDIFSTFPKGLQYRRDLVFAQVLSPVIAGFTVKLSENLENRVFMEQITRNGLLVNFESLITAYGDEMGMLEDSIVAYNDLKKVTFKFVSDNSQKCFPSLEGNRQELTVYIPLHQDHFGKLPSDLQNGQRISIFPVVFNIGINEHATIAERFGDMSIQDSINMENLNQLYGYYEKFSSFFPEWAGTRYQSHTSLSMLMANLQVVVNSKKSKNVEIFRLCEEICQRMNGIRLTTCKSAKDRTAMAVTLEAVRTLQREHRLPPELFSKTLSTMRSHGTRLLNSLKNVGIPKYAFNRMQVRAYPSLYRAPEGTFGRNVQN